MLDFESLVRSDEYRDSGLAVEVPLTFLLRSATSSVDCFDLSVPEGWERMMRYKGRDTGMGHLIASIQQHGFRQEGAIGFDPRFAQITEGHHRLTAAILLCLDTVWITQGGSSWCKDGSQWAEVVDAHSNHSDPYPIEV